MRCYIIAGGSRRYKAPDFPSGCDDIERIETRTILDKNSLVDSMIDFTYKLASDYVETEPTTLIQSNAESQRKFSVLCDFDNYSSGGKNIIDLVQEWLDGQDEDKFPSDIDSSALVLCQDMSNVRQLYDEGICTNGCSVGDPHVNPTINDVQLPTFQGVGHWVSAHICINIPDGKERSIRRRCLIS